MSWLLPSLPSLWKTAPDPGPETNGTATGASDSNGHADTHPGVATESTADSDSDLDVPPPFPLPNSSQRSAAPPPSAPSFALAPPSPPRARDSTPPSDLNIAILPDAVPLGDMAPPPSTTAKPSFGIATGAATGGLTAGAGANGAGGAVGLTPAPAPAKKKRGKVALAPGCSALDWARLAKSGVDLRGTGSMVPMRVTMDELKKHKSRDDAWSVFNGVVYNITPYLRFHPGGEDELMRVAGRDGTKLFMLTHSWVNMEHLMAECAVGMLVRG